MKSIILSIATAALLMGPLGQQGIQAQENAKDPKATALLDAMSKKAKGHDSFKIVFDYRLQNPSAEIDETQSGEALMKKDKYRINIAGQEIVTDGKTVWTYVEDADEVTIDEVSKDDEEDDNIFNPNTLFDLYKKGFKYKYDKETNENGATLAHIKLFPEKAGEKPYHTVILVIDKVKSEMRRIIAKTKDGNTYTYDLKSFVPNVPVSADTFVFNTEEVDEVIDLR